MSPSIDASTGERARRTYNQYCSLARALDIVGDRWTLLLVRELMLGPKRFTDLLDGLPGIGTNLLAQRLKDLQALGLVSRSTMPPPAASTVYELTEDGEALRPAVHALSRWGLGRLGEKRSDEVFRAEWAILALETVANRAATRGVHDVYEVTVDGVTFHLRVDDGRVESAPGAATDADVRIEMDGETFMGIGAGTTSAEDAIAAGRLHVEGRPAAIKRAAAILIPTSPASARGAGRPRAATRTD